MNTWVIKYEDDSALEEILKIGIVKYKPNMNLKFIFMDTYLSKEEILGIKGVKECREPRIGTVNV